MTDLRRGVYPRITALRPVTLVFGCATLARPGRGSIYLPQQTRRHRCRVDVATVHGPLEYLSGTADTEYGSSWAVSDHTMST